MLDTNALRELVRFIAASGGEPRTGAKLNGYVNLSLYWRDVGNLRVLADPESWAAGVVNLDERDPFVSWDRDGAILCPHYGRYGGPSRIALVATRILINKIPAADVFSGSEGSNSFGNA